MKFAYLNAWTSRVHWEAKHFPASFSTTQVKCIKISSDLISINFFHTIDFECITCLIMSFINILIQIFYGFNATTNFNINMRFVFFQ